MNPDLLADVNAAKQLLADLKISLEDNTTDVQQYATRIRADLSPEIVGIMTSATDSNEIATNFMLLFNLFLDPATVSFYQQPVVLQWLDLILDELKVIPPNKL